MSWRSTRRHAGVTFVSEHVEVITGVNLPMLIRLARPQKAGFRRCSRARCGSTGRHAGGVGSAEGRSRDPLHGHDSEPARPRRALRSRGQRLRLPDPEWTGYGKSIMGALAALRCVEGSGITGGRPGRGRGRCALIERGWTRRHARDRTRVSWTSARRSCSSAAPAIRFRHPARPRPARGTARGSAPPVARAAPLQYSPLSASPRAGAEHAYPSKSC